MQTPRKINIKLSIFFYRLLRRVVLDFFLVLSRCDSRTGSSLASVSKSSSLSTSSLELSLSATVAPATTFFRFGTRSGFRILMVAMLVACRGCKGFFFLTISFRFFGEVEDGASWKTSWLSSENIKIILCYPGEKCLMEMSSKFV